MMIDSSMSRLNSHASASCSTPCALHRGKGRKHSHRMYMQPRLQSPPCVRQTSMMASEGKEGRSFNPFRNKKKEDAAKKALEDMFGGKQDMLAAYDSGGGNSGKGGGRRGGGGGDGGESEPFNFRQWLAAFAQGLGKTARSLGKTLAAVLLLASIFYGSHFIQPLTQAAKKGVRWLLRLDGAGSRRVQRRPAPVPVESAAALGESERSVLAKYGADDEDNAEQQQHDASEDDEDGD